VPTLGDFSLVGWFAAHMCYDPWPNEVLMPGRPHIRRWMIEMFNILPNSSPTQNPVTRLSELQAHNIMPFDVSKASQGWDDRADIVPKSLMPILEIIGREFVPHVQLILDKTNLVVKKYPNKSFPRRVGDACYPMGPFTAAHPEGKPFCREAIPFSLWKAQNVMDEYHRLTPENKSRVRSFTQKVPGLEALLDMKIPLVERHNLKVKLVKTGHELTDTAGQQLQAK
jgi:hypothetical protein